MGKRFAITSCTLKENNRNVSSAILTQNVFLSYVSNISISLTIQNHEYGNTKKVYLVDSDGKEVLLGSWYNRNNQIINLSNISIGTVKFPLYIKVYWEAAWVPGGWELIYSYDVPAEYVDYYEPYDVVCRTFVGSNLVWGVYLNMKWCANSHYDETTQRWTVPTINNNEGFINYITVNVYIYNSSGKLIASSGTIDVSARYETTDYRDLLAITSTGDPPDIATADGEDTLLATMIPGRGAYYANKLVYSYNKIYDPDDENHTVRVVVRDRFGICYDHTDSAIYYGGPVFSFGHKTVDIGKSTERTIMNFDVNVPIKLNELYINNQTLRDYIYDVKHPSE